MRLPSSRNRSRATALAVTLLLHVAAAFWLLALRFEPKALIEDFEHIWLPATATPPPPPPPPVDSNVPPPLVAPITAAPLPLLMPEVAPTAVPDWSAAAREVAKGIGAGPSYQPFGETPKAPPGRPKEVYPPSIFEKPLPRVGKTVVTPDGETIVWVSDNCWVSLSSRSLTMQHIHKAREGVRMCQIGVGKKEVRGDLFDSIKRPPPPQEPGCGPDGIGQSCAR